MASEAVASTPSKLPQLPATPLKSPTMYLNRNGSSSRSLPLAATTTRLNITSNASNPASEGQKDKSTSEGQPQKQESRSDRQVAFSGENAAEKPLAQTASAGVDAVDAGKDEQTQSKSNRDSVGWLNWFGKNADAKGPNDQAAGVVPSSNSTDNVAHDKLANPSPDAPQDFALVTKQRTHSDPNPVLPDVRQEQPPRSWLSLWSNATAQSSAGPRTSGSGVAMSGVDKDTVNGTEQAEQKPPNADSVDTPRPPPEPPEPAKSYAWSFWSKDEPKAGEDKKRSGSMSGKLAQADSPTQSRPENANIDESRGVPDKVGKRQRPQSVDPNTITPKANSSAAEDGKKTNKAEASAQSTKSMSLAAASLKAKRVPENLLLPSFKGTYSTVEKPGIVQRLGRFFQSNLPIEAKHVDLVHPPHRVKKALAIGVHGYFPAPLIRSVLGQPTGTSLRFANGAATAIQKWAQDQGYSCEVEKVALEGEGKIAERVELLWKLMVNWLSKIQNADFVMIACHSQGVPVAMMLVSKLIATGCVNSAKIGVCAMAGVNLGPFADYKSRWISGSAGELFDFARPESQVSKDYEAALVVALNFGVKIVYVGSIDDQLVSLDSSTFGNLQHPYVYRAVFVDGRVHAPDFLTHLVGFALKLRNLGIVDHGLIRELSSPLAGSLYSGEGHSRIYDDEAVYYLAVQYSLETTDLGHVSPIFTSDSSAVTAQNPYILPFAMRGLLEEEYVRTELESEITELIKQFDDWKPSSKVLKDVKFRLEGVRSKL